MSTTTGPVPEDDFDRVHQIAKKVLDLLEREGLSEIGCGMTIATVLGALAGALTDPEERELYMAAANSTAQRVINSMAAEDERAKRATFETDAVKKRTDH